MKPMIGKDRRYPLTGVLYALPLLLALLLLLAANPPRAAAAETFCVVDELLPIMETPGGSYTIEDYYVVDADGIMGLVVYGNHVQVAPLEGTDHDDTWAELLDPDGGAPLGYVEKRGLEPVPSYETMTSTPFVVRADEPGLLLQPGAAAAKYGLSRWKFALLRGEIVNAYGRASVEGVDWLLLGFTTSIDDEGADGGVGMRYAWIQEEDMLSLAAYEPNYRHNEERWLPAKTRTASGPSEPLSGDIRSRLLGRGFSIGRNSLIPDYVAVDDLCDLYAATGNYTVDFITTDLFLHAYHLLFSRMLQKLEQTYFAPTLGESLSTALRGLDESTPKLAAGAPKTLGPAATARDMLTIPLFLLGQLDEADLSARAREEAHRILKAEGRDLSLITGSREDYTQYRPRGHYTGVPEMEAYFRAMSFLGNAGLPIFQERGVVHEPNLLTTILLVLAFDGAAEMWTAFEEPINFLIGTPDDGAFKLYRSAVKRHVTTIDDLGTLFEDHGRGKLTAIAEDIRQTVGSPRIRDRETGNITKEEEKATRLPEFRISGKRFTFDAYAMNSLTSPRVGSDENPRNLPEGTDVMAVLGSNAADEWAAHNDEIEGYAESLAAIKSSVDGFLAVDNTAYTRWLDILRAGFADSGSKQVFYRSHGWQWKKLLTNAASWAELKHDTVLYAKQSGAEMGGGGDWYAGQFAPPMPRGYVEPDPQTFAAMLAALERLSLVLEMYALEDDVHEYADKIERFRELCTTAMRIAEREVRDEKLSPVDYGDIKELARAFTARLLLPYGTDVGYDEWEKLRMAIVTDVATDFMGEVALHVGTGTPRAIYVLVNDRSGGPRVAKGYVYSYYEFAHPLSEGRMTDDEWREIVYDKARSADLEQLHPHWYGALEAD